MDDKDWRILKTIAEERNLTKAAARLYISQPALTYRLKNIEEEFGAQVVSRVPSGVELTPQGEYLLAYAAEMLHKFGAVKERIKNMVDKVQGSLRIGASSVFAHYTLPKILKGFLTFYPEVQVSLKTGLSSKVVEMLQRQEVTLAIVRGDHEWDGERFLLSEEPLCLASRGPVEFGELLARPYIRYNTDFALQRLLEDWWRKNFNAPPNTAMEVTTMETARQMVLHGLGWSILPGIGLARKYGLYSQPLHWPDGTPLMRKTWVLCSNGSLELQTVRAFLNYLESGRPLEG